ncbi:MAG: TlpA disulfide reductase family protein [Bacteroidales bacterium]
MKKTNQIILTAIAVLVSFYSCNLNNKSENKQAQICVQGKILSPVDTPLMAEFNHKTDSIAIDSLNEFIHCIESNKAAYIDIKLRRIQFTIYACPGDTIHLKIDAAKHNDPVDFHGNDTKASEYLYALRTQILTHPVFNDLLRQDSVEKFTAGTEKLQDSLSAKLDHFVQYMNDDYFTSLENMRIEYLIQNQKIRYSKYHKFITGEPIPDSASYFSFLKNTALENPQALVLPEYINYLKNAFLFQLDDNAHDSAGYPDDIKYQLKSVRDNIKNDEIKLTLFYEILSGYAQYNGFDGLDSEYTWLINNMSNDNKQSTLETLHATWDKISKGKKAPGFTYPDASGDSISLSDFKGKPVYIDVWASWCGPCIREIPHLDSLYHEYKDKNLVFLSVSVDEKKSGWVKALKTHNMPWTQLHTGGWDCKICDDYNIKGIPRFILIDHMGKIISASAPRPSSDEIKPLLNKHLNQKNSENHLTENQTKSP